MNNSKTTFSFPTPSPFPNSPQSKISSSYETNDTLIPTIDQIIDHHYFQSRLQEILEKSKGFSDSKAVYGLDDNQYYKEQDDLVEELTNVLEGSIESKMRDVLTKEFINIGDEVEAIKGEIWAFMEEQTKKGDELRREFIKHVEEVKRKLLTSSAMSNISSLSSNPPTYSVGTRFSRNTQSTFQSSQNSESKSYHSELLSLKKEIEEIKEKGEKSESLRILNEEFSEFKIEVKVAIEAVKYQNKKLALDVTNIGKSSQNVSTISPALKENIESTVRRIISAQLKVYASYSEQISEIRESIEQFDDKLNIQGDKQTEYLSNQLKSVWNVINDVKRVLDQVTDDMGMSTSRILM